MMKDENYDVIIVGGSYAGLSAAMSLGRSLRKVLVIDSGKPCNAPTPHSHNFLTQDGRTPSEIASMGRQQLETYRSIKLINDTAVTGTKQGNGFVLSLHSALQVFGKKLIFATGIKDQLLDIPGFKACWGISVVHCPYCHGYEFRQKKTAILANGEAAMHYAMLVGNLTKDLTVLTNGPANFTEEQFEKLNKHGIPVIESEVTAIEHANGHVRQVALHGGKRIAFDAVYFRPPFTQHCNIPEMLGCEINEQGYLKIDSTQKTTVDGVFACGDNSSAMRSVANAVATGNFSGAVVNKELAGEEF